MIIKHAFPGRPREHDLATDIWEDIMVRRA